MDAPDVDMDVPDACLNGDHDFGQASRCRECNADRADTTTARFSGGAGSTTHPLSDEDYRREMDKLTAKAGQ